MDQAAIDIAVKDAASDPLPGAVAQLTADRFARTFVSDADGQVRFSDLGPGFYALRVGSTGFNTVLRPEIDVDMRSDVRLQIGMTTDAE
ncbi:MAG: carboxypeptidase-like regulatory domain-containing protein [Rhodobacter sp.]|nr:carboxypeptidase-like regulatory domain-containing protein [Rhodobacter sp.]